MYSQFMMHGQKNIKHQMIFTTTSYNCIQKHRGVVDLYLVIW